MPSATDQSISENPSISLNSTVGISPLSASAIYGVHTGVVKLTGDLLAGMIFCHIAYNIRENKSRGLYQMDNRTWRYSSIKSLYRKYEYLYPSSIRKNRKADNRDSSLSWDMIRRSIKKILDCDILIKREDKKRGLSWYALSDGWIGCENPIENKVEGDEDIEKRRSLEQSILYVPKSLQIKESQEGCLINSSGGDELINNKGLKKNSFKEDQKKEQDKTSPTLPSDDQSTSKPELIYPDTHIEFCERFRSRTLEAFPNDNNLSDAMWEKKTRLSWLKDIPKILKRYDIELLDLYNLHAKVLADDFWRKNIRSPRKYLKTDNDGVYYYNKLYDQLIYMNGHDKENDIDTPVIDYTREDDIIHKIYIMCGVEDLPSRLDKTWDKFNEHRESCREMLDAGHSPDKIYWVAREMKHKGDLKRVGKTVAFGFIAFNISEYDMRWKESEYDRKQSQNRKPVFDTPVQPKEVGEAGLQLMRKALGER